MKPSAGAMAAAGMFGAGLALGTLAVLLSLAGNPSNMGLCLACFLRDLAGALGLHRAATVQYLRPEIPGIVFGAFLAALLGREARERSAPAAALSFLLGACLMMGALVFLGCPLRMALRLGGGDLNALVGLAGFAAGIAAGVFCLGRGYSLGRAVPSSAAAAWTAPILAAGLVVLVLARPAGLLFSAKGPGSQAAPLGLALAAGVVAGLLAQRGRICFAGGIRDLLLIRSPHLFCVLAGTVAAVLALNLFLGRFHPGFAGQPVAHAEHLWNFLGLALVGLAAVLLGGCPLRQLVLAAGGHGSAAAAVAGMIAGAALAHNFDLAASPAGVPAAGKIAVAAGLAVCLVIGLGRREK